MNGEPFERTNNIALSTEIVVFLLIHKFLLTIREITLFCHTFDFD